MGTGKSDKIYKEREKHELLHVGQETVQLQAQQPQLQQPQMQQTDQMQETLKKYQMDPSEVDLSVVQQAQSANMEQNIVVTTSIHETERAERVLSGEQLSEQSQEQIAKQEQQMHQTQAKQEQQANKTQKQLSPSYAALASLNEQLQADHDTASPEFQNVKETMKRLMDLMSGEHVIERHQEQAIFDLRKAAVHYYNTHRGYRWSRKGKKRKELINNIIDQVQEALISDETSALVKYDTLCMIARDTSAEGMSSIKTQRFFRAQAEKVLGAGVGDEYTYLLHCEMKRQDARDDKIKELTGHSKRKKIVGFTDKAAYTFCVPFYYTDENGQPLDEQEQRKMEEGQRFLNCMESDDIQIRKPALDQYLQKILDWTPDQRLFEPEYVWTHFGEVKEQSLLLLLYSNLFVSNQENGQYLQSLPQHVQDQIEMRSMIATNIFGGWYPQIMRAKNIDQSGVFFKEEERIELGGEMKRIKKESIYREFMKKGHVPICQDEDGAPEAPVDEDGMPETLTRTRWSKRGYLLANDTMDHPADAHLALSILAFQNYVPQLVSMNLQEELRKAQAQG